MWIADLTDGRTITEKDMDWDDLPVENISCLHITNGTSSARIHAQKGYQFFQFKKRAILVNVLSGDMRKTPVFWQRIGAVVNDQGDCIYIQMEQDGTFDIRFDNVFKMKLNLDHLRIALPSL